MSDRADMKRFAGKVRAMPNGCWEWQGHRMKTGYGHFRCVGKLWTAHRFSYFARNGGDQKGVIVHHLRDNPPCVNPSHLVAMSQTRHVASTNHISGSKIILTGVCIYGHPFSGENLYISPKGDKQCRSCKARRARERKARRRQVRSATTSL